MTELETLQNGPLSRFSDWPNPAVPLVAARVYTFGMGFSSYMLVWPGDHSR